MRATPLSVLVVHENPVILTFIAKVLHQDGIRALLARNIQEAAGIAERGYVPIDLILADMTMPDSTGAEVADRVRRIRPGCRAIFMSASDEDGVIQLKLMKREEDRSSLPLTESSLAGALRSAAGPPMVRRGSASA